MKFKSLATMMIILKDYIKKEKLVLEELKKNYKELCEEYDDLTKELREGKDVERQRNNLNLLVEYSNKEIMEKEKEIREANEALRDLERAEISFL